MKSIRTIFPLLLIALVVGCISNNTTLPKPSAGFTPKQIYAAASEKVWRVILDALDKNRITTTSTDKASGVIQTDYIGGPGGFNVLSGAQNTRYKYNVTVRSPADGQTKVNIVCKIESTMHGAGGSSQWHDVTGQNMKVATDLESWLYEQIEKGL